MDFKIVPVKISSNSTFPIVVNIAGLPNPLLIDYMLILKNKLDPGTMELYCRDLLLLLQFCFDRNIILKDKIKDLNFFNITEIYSLTEWYLKKNIRNKSLTISSVVYNRRNLVISSFLNYSYNKIIDESSYSLKKKIILKQNLKQSIGLLKMRIVSHDPGSDSNIKGLDIVEQEQLLAIIYPQSDSNPFASSFNFAVQWRNYVFILLLLRTGIRKAEALLLEFSDLTIGSDSFIRIRNKDSIEYKRRRKPYVKTRGRHIPIDSELSKALLHYIQFKRDNLNLSSHDNEFIFISSRDGGPMSVESPNKIFTQVSQKIFDPSKTKFTPHILRNTFNNNLYRIMKLEHGKIDYDLMAYLNGWHPDSQMLSLYAKKEIRASASTILIDRQNKYFDESK